MTNESSDKPEQPPEQPPAQPPEQPQDQAIEPQSAGEGPGFPTFVTQIKSAEQQVGEHVIRALQHHDTVAVLTIVQAGPGGQSMVSIPLSANMMEDVQVMLQQEATTRPTPSEVACVGFHCVVEAREQAGGSSGGSSEGQGKKS